MTARDAIVAEIPRLRRYARALTGRADRADDLVQDTLERALDKWRFWQRERELRPWLFSIMHNLHVDALRREGVVEYRDDESMPEPALPGGQEAALAMRDLDRALAALPLDQRQVLLLVALEELSYADVSRVLGIPPGTVMSRLSRARTRLKILLEEPTGPVLKVVSA